MNKGKASLRTKLLMAPRNPKQKMETTIVYGSYIGVMEKEMEITILYRPQTLHTSLLQYVGRLACCVHAGCRGPETRDPDVGYFPGTNVRTLLPLAELIQNKTTAK